jgi:fatty acid desaturase
MPWARELSTGNRAAIKRLHEVKPMWNLVIPFFVILWASAAALQLAAPVWPVRVLTYVVIGICIHGLANLMHEGIHGNLFRNRRLDRWVGFALGAPALFSVSAYRTNHLLHHRYTRGAEDPDELTNLISDRRVLSAVFYLLLLVGMVIYIAHVPINALRRGKPRERRAVLIEYALLALLYSGVTWLAVRGHAGGVLVNCWLVPMTVAAAFGNLRSLAEHAMTEKGDPLTETRTVTSNRILSFLNCNLNYHLEHHLFPAVPWYNLPKVHALLRDDYPKIGAFVYRSYARFLWDAIRAGVHGQAPEPSVRFRKA